MDPHFEVTVEGEFTGGHLLHLAAAGCVLNDLYREAATLGIALAGARVTAAGGFDTSNWQSTGISYSGRRDTPGPASRSRRPAEQLTRSARQAPRHSRPPAYNEAMLYMVIETYRHGPGPVYQRAAERGRLLPDSLRYVDSWVVDDDRLDRCFQLMETDDPGLVDVWQSRWADLTEFEVVPVVKSAEAAARVDIQWG
jgi:hypothetical protein